MATTTTTKKQTNNNAGTGLIEMPARILAVHERIDVGAFLQDTTQADSQAIQNDGAPGGDRADDGTPGESDMKYINRLSRTGNLDPKTLYAFDTSISTERIDSCFTRMDITSLTNYARDAMLGKPVMNSHKTGGWNAPQLNLGRSFWGGLGNDPQIAGAKRTETSTFLRRGSTSNGEVNTDSIIADIDAGVISDVSIGFGFRPGTPERNFADRTWFRCSICGKDFLAFNPNMEEMCWHFAGEVEETDDGTNRKELCYADVLNAILNEYSLVYAGATPGAVVLKAQRAAESGMLTRSKMRHLENVYNVRLSNATQIYLPESVIERKQEVKQTQQAEAERKNEPMATKIDDTPKATAKGKRELEAARLEGAKEQIALTLKTIMDTRVLNDVEHTLVKRIMESAAAGDMVDATATLAQLTAGVPEDTDLSDVSLELTEPSDDSETSDDDKDSRGESDGAQEEEEPEPERGQEPTVGRGESSFDLTALQLTATERQQLTELRQANRELKKENQQLSYLAEVGKRYKDNLINATWEQAVRADLPGVTETNIKQMLRGLPVEHIESMHDQYKVMGDRRLSVVDNDGKPSGSGGRQTQALNPNTPQGLRAMELPAHTQPRVDVSLYSTSSRR
jgi:hypothetical protein